MGLKEILGRNLRKPKGFFGKIVGLLMNKGNDHMNRFTLQKLDAQNNDIILEIGFGNGKYIAELAQITQNGVVAGVDYSETMVKVARKRNKRFIQQGVVDIKLGEVNRIPFEADKFDKVYTVNTIYFWPNPESDMKEIYRVLKPGGLLIISFRPKAQMEKMEITKNGFRLYESDEVIQLMYQAGFREVKVEKATDKQLDVYCVMGYK